MALHPPPTIDAGLVLVNQKITHSAVGHTYEVTYALSPSAGATAQQCADEAQTEFIAAWQALLDTNCTILPNTILLGDGTNVPAVAVGSGANAIGTNAFVSAPPNCCILIKKLTAFAGKKNRGRVYMPGIVPAADVSENGTVDPTWLGSVQTAAADWLADLAAFPLPMVIANKVLVVTPPEIRPHVTAIHAGHAVTTLNAEATIATQRRRMPRS